MNIHNVGQTLQAMHPAWLLSTRLLLPFKSSASAQVVVLDEQNQNFENRARTITEVLKGIEGYSHGGLNE